MILRPTLNSRARNSLFLSRVFAQSIKAILFQFMVATISDCVSHDGLRFMATQIFSDVFRFGGFMCARW